MKAARINFMWNKHFYSYYLCIFGATTSHVFYGWINILLRSLGGSFNFFCESWRKKRTDLVLEVFKEHG